LRHSQAFGRCSLSARCSFDSYSCAPQPELGRAQTQLSDIFSAPLELAKSKIDSAIQTQLSDIFSAPLELAKSKIDSAIKNDEADDDPAAQLNVARTPCLAGSTDTDCTKHWVPYKIMMS